MVNLQNLGTLGVEQFPNRAWYNFFLESIFLSSMSASIKKSKPKSDKVATNKTKQTTIFSAKNKLSLFETNFPKFEGKVRFGKFFFENDPLDELNQMSLSKKLHLFGKLVKNAK